LLWKWTRSFQQNPDSLKKYLCALVERCASSDDGLTRVETDAAPLTLNHQGQFPVVTFSFHLAPDASLGHAVDAINAAKQDLNMPPSIQGRFQGTACGLSKFARK